MNIDRIFIVGLPDRFRGASLEAQLARAGLDSRRSDGIRVLPHEMHGRDDVDPIGAALLLRRPMSPSEVGCALAHQRVYEQILDEGLGSAIVFEDDARLRRPLDLDVLAGLLAVEHPRVVALYAPRGFAIVDETRAIVGDAAAVIAYPTIVPPTTTTAYALNSAAAGVLARHGRPVSHVADWPVWAEVHCEFLMLAEAVAAPDERAGSQIDRAEDATTRPARTRGRVRRLLHLDWARHRRLYADYRTFVAHELMRQTVFAWANRGPGAESGRAPAPLGSEPPIAAPAMLRLAARVVARPRAISAQRAPTRVSE